MRLREGSLFSGYNGLGMAVSEVFGSEPAWFSEIEPGPSKILEHHWPDVPNLGDITEIDWDAVEAVDILSGGFPCTDVSLAGRRAGLTPHTRSGLWNFMAYGISKIRPRYVVIENVRGLLSAEAHSDVEPCPWCLGEGSGEPDLRALGAVLGDLAGLGYDAQWCGLRAADIGAPHGRYRIFILATDAGHRGEPEWARETRREAGERTAIRSKPRRDRPTPTNASHIGHEWSRSTRDRWAGPEDGSHALADTDRNALWKQSVTESGRGGQAIAGLTGADIAERRGTPTAWGQYAPAIERWERILGRLAPTPTELGAKGGQRLAPRFVEWMQGLPIGHITAVPGVNRNAQLKALGNGVVPQQATEALRNLLEVA